MKRRFLIIPVFLILTLITYLASCTSNVPQATFSSVTFDSESLSVSFTLSISDSDLASDYVVNLKSTTNDSIETQTISITDTSESEYSFTNLTEEATYTLYVTCTYGDTKNYQIKSTYTFSASTSESSTSTSDETTTSSYAEQLGITYEDATVEYDGSSHMIYATYTSNGSSETITSNCYIYGSATYYISYASTNSVDSVGTHTQELYIYSVSGSFINPSYTLLETETATLTITKGTTIYEFSDFEVDYTGEAVSMPINVSGMTYTFYDSSNTEVDEIVNPGTYTVNYSFAGNDYYEAIEGSFNVTVNKASITSTITSQTTILDEDGKASLSIDSSMFNISNVTYTVAYYDSDGNKLDTDYVTETGTYTVEISIEESDYYKAHNIAVKLYVVEDLDEESIIVANVEFFSITSISRSTRVSTSNYYAYVYLYNASATSIDLSTISVSINETDISLTGTIEAYSSYTILIYTGNTSLTVTSLGSSITYDFSSYADESVESSVTGLSSVAVTYSNITNEYTISSTYSNYYAYLSDRENKVYTYVKLSSISKYVAAVESFGYTTVAPTVSYTFDFTTISLSRIEDLYAVTATDGLGNEITVDSSMVDTSEITSENINTVITITYNISDMYGNVNTFTLEFTLVDEEAPTIELSDSVAAGSLVTHVSLYDNIELTAYFYAYDDLDGEITITSDMIDDGGLDTSAQGKYTITVTVSDSSGNSASLSIVIYVDEDVASLSSYLTDSSQTIKTSDTGEGNSMPSSGDVKVLVVPLFFSSSNETSTFLSTLDTVFNDSTGSLSFGSVASYYSESSYGKLNLTFEIFSDTYIELSKTYTYYDSHITEIFTYALEILDDYIDFSDYDSDGDGTIDAIWFVYDMDYVSSSNYFWAWTADMSSYLTTSYDGVNVGKICFASYEFTDASDSYYDGYADYGTGLTARTYTHETGHLLGLADYYDYDYDKTVGYHHTMFGVDLMDSNYGDLDAASKLMLGWIDPIVISDDDVVTIESTALTGDAIIIAKESNIGDTIFTEYIILEFWTPDGLNELDSNETFGSSNYGIRVLHLDATINYVDGVATLTSGTRSSYFKYNNTDDDNHNFLETLAYDIDSVYDTQTYTYNTIGTVLFEDTTTVFGEDVYCDFTYNTGEALDFTFQILSISSTSVTVYINFD